MLTGASGFIGRRLVVALRNAYPAADLRCLVKNDDDAFCRTGSDFLRAHGLDPIGCDLLTGQYPTSQGPPDIAFHLAANTHTWEQDQRSNDIATQNLVRALMPLSSRTHVVFTSTVAVLDNRRAYTELLTADTPVTAPPLSRYGRAKLKAEEFLRAAAREIGFSLSIVRLCTVYGSPSRPNTFFDVLRRQVAKRSVASRLNWPGLTSFIHVDDVVECLVKISQGPPPSGSTSVHLLATESRTVREVAAWIYEASGTPLDTIDLPALPWKLLANIASICRAGNSLPARWFNSLWRLNLIVNPVFNCISGPARAVRSGKFRSIQDYVSEP